MKILVENHGGDAAQEDRRADGDDDERDRGCALGRLDRQTDAAACRRVTAATSAISAASGSGMPAATAKNVTMPPIITNSPCAKLITSEAL